ncbi:MAG: hypothetical protein ACD_37C00671G0012 [uncultured bacterium]|nr:MAG: hypothetical protein ACD_37C00671G0012 [uncultured bacterium]
MNNKSFGLDIGVSTIKAVELTPDKNGFKLNACIVSPTPPKGMLSESPVDEEEMAQTIKKTLAEARISTKRVNIALPENQAYTKVVDMPYLSDRELASAIYWEAEQYIPIPLSNVSLSWNVINRKVQANEKMLVLMVGAPSIVVKKYQKVISLAGLTISSMETEMLATVRALTSFLPPNSITPTIIINIGTISTSLAIVIGSNLVFTYSIPLGGAAINRAISTDFGLSYAQAQEYQKTYGISNSPLGQRIGKSTEPILSSILSEVKKAVIYYSQKYKDSKIEQILLSGETAKIPGIDMYFANSSGIETVIANPWKFLGENIVPKEIMNNAPDYSIAVGLSLRAYER